MSILRPNRRKDRKPDKEYFAYIASMACIVCVKLGIRQLTRTEVAHVGDRGLGQKSDDRETAPVCCLHHRLGSDSLHRAGKKFWKIHKLNRLKLIAALQKGFDR